MEGGAKVLEDGDTISLVPEYDLKGALGFVFDSQLPQHMLSREKKAAQRRKSLPQVCSKTHPI